MKNFIKNHKSVLLLLAILLLATFLRFYVLGQNPPSIDWDEASLGYNAYSLLKTGRDEFGRVWPISLRSFEDYKPAVYSYLTMGPVLLFGLTEYAVRLPSAVLGVLTVLMAYLLAKEFFSEKTALLVSLFLAISPWHLQFSRIAFESNASVFFVTAGLWMFMKGLKQGRWLFVSALLFCISFYTYHSPRLVVPLILLGWSVYFRKSLLTQKRTVVTAALFGVLLLIPFMREAFSQGTARLSSVTVLTAQGTLDESIRQIEFNKKIGDSLGVVLHNRRIVYALAVAKGYLDHFNLDFLFLRGDAPNRHHARDMGMLYIWDGIFVLIGFLLIFKGPYRFPILWWYFCAPAASAITTGTPHAVRSLLFLPIYQIFIALGVGWVWNTLRKKTSPRVASALIVLIIGALMINMVYYLDEYYTQTPIEASADWQYGYKQALAVSEPYESGVSQVVMTYAYDQPYIYVLFYRLVDPTWYQQQYHGEAVIRDQRSFGKYVFRKIDWKNDQNLKNVLFIGTPGEIPDGVVGKIADIHFLDGSIALRIVKR